MNKAIDDLIVVLKRVASENSAKEVKECDSSKLKAESDIFVHKDNSKDEKLKVGKKERRKKEAGKKISTEEEILNEWEDNERSIDTIFLPRSRGPLGRSRDVDLKRVNITINGNELLTGATLRLHAGRHYGLMILHVKQEVEGDDTPVLETVIRSDKERLNLLKVIDIEEE